MPEWSGAPKESKPHRLISRLITASCAKVPPAPPYCSGIAAHSRPAAPALVHVSRSYIPCSCQRSRWGVNSLCMKRRACSSSSTTSSLIQAGRGRSRAVMARSSGSHVDATKPPSSWFDITQLLLHPLVEALDIDHHAFVGSPADRLLLVARLDLQAQPPALDADQPRGGDDAHADRRGRVVADVELDAEALMARRQQGLDGVERRGLHQVDHHRGGEHPHPPAPDAWRRMGVVDDELGGAFAPDRQMREINHA